ncbi:MAG: HD-GYP domain-containing protein, partial [Nitrospinota bacterium]
NKWYQVQIKIDPELNHLLVWLDNITGNKDLDQRLSIVKLFTSEIMTSIRQITKANDIYERLSLLILQDGYRGVFITRKSNSGHLIGVASKIENDKYIKSEPIEIQKISSAPVMDSRKYQRIVAETKTEDETQEAFDKAHPFDAGVRKFLGFDIENFVNFHQGDVSIIGFNRENGICKQDLSVMEALVNTAISTVSLIDLSKINEDRFLQIISGLASASEYSDELTGKHILRVNEYSKLLAGELSCGEEFTEFIGQVAALHDIGKVAMPEIIKLERKLSEEEFQQMTMHAIYGAQIIEQMAEQSSYADTRLIMARNIALNHHQQWNGKGYPGLIDGKNNLVRLHSKNPRDYLELRPLSGDAIPIESIIVSLSDKYDALRSARQYKPAFSHEKTTEILLKDDRTGTSGKDIIGPRLMELYLDIQQQFNEIFENMRDD